ncbi:MAG: SLC26A/SulP transporter family protein, partial [Deltaproteobacteria bacterium]|nr:SLC26A/SulP transporter family protein [Deltaproteobacteria bacterium]
YIPYQVVSGYLSGVALVIAIGQIPKWLGLANGVSLSHGIISPDLWQWPSIVVGLVTIIVTVIAPRVTKRVPAAILGLGSGIGAYFAIGAFHPNLLVVTNNPFVVGPITTTASIIDVVKGTFLSLAAVSFADIERIAASAATLSVLLSIDTLKTGVVLDALTQRRSNANRELFAQGLANVVAALTGGMPGAGTMGPTLVNVTSGGRSPWSGFFEGVFTVLAFLLLGSVIAWVPIGALAGILLVVAWKMFDWGMFRLALKPTTRLDFVVIAIVITVAKGIGLIQASIAGISLSILLFIRDQVRSSVILRKRDLREVASKTHRLPAVRALLDEHGDQGLLLELRDNLFFGTTDQLLSELAEDLQTRRYILVDLRRIQSMDYTAGHLFSQMEERLAAHGGQLLLSGMPTTLSTPINVERYLTQLGLLGSEGSLVVYDTQNDALEWMEERILEAEGWTKAELQPLELGELELFREFDDEALFALAKIAEPLHLYKGETLFKQGDEGDELYLIRRGEIAILLPLVEEKRHHLATMARGDYFGELSFLDNDPRSADAEAKTATDLYKLSRAAFNDVAHSDPIIPVKVFARLALLVSRRLRTANAELHVLELR